MGGLKETATLAAHLLGWYACNSAFNVYNKQALNEWHFPWLVAWLELLAGVSLVLPLWVTGLRRAPKVDYWLAGKFTPIGLLHSSGHSLQVAAMGSGTVFMANVVKATEPIVGTVVARLFLGKTSTAAANLSLVVIVAGVCLAALKPGTSVDPLVELRSFATLAALGSTVVFACAKVLVKKLMTPALKKERHLDAGNNYALLTCASCAAICVPALYLEGAKAAAAPPPPNAALLNIFLAGAFYYASNEFSFRVLDLLGPVPQAVANAAKRIFVLVAAVVFLGEKLTEGKLIGSALALASSFSQGMFRRTKKDRMHLPPPLGRLLLLRPRKSQEKIGTILWNKQIRAQPPPRAHLCLGGPRSLLPSTVVFKSRTRPALALQLEDECEFYTPEAVHFPSS